MKNKQVIMNALIALLLLILTYTVHWIFIIGAIALVWKNQKELLRK